MSHAATMRQLFNWSQHGHEPRQASPILKTPPAKKVVKRGICQQCRPLASWPLVGNEGINLYIGILGIHSLIPY